MIIRYSLCGYIFIKVTSWWSPMHSGSYVLCNMDTWRCFFSLSLNKQLPSLGMSVHFDHTCQKASKGKERIWNILFFGDYPVIHRGGSFATTVVAGGTVGNTTVYGALAAWLW
jgi:hypothetical protein